MLTLPMTPVGSVALEEGPAGGGEAAPPWLCEGVFFEAHDQRGGDGGGGRFFQEGSAIGLSIHKQGISLDQGLAAAAPITKAGVLGAMLTPALKLALLTAGFQPSTTMRGFSPPRSFKAASTLMVLLSPGSSET